MKINNLHIASFGGLKNFSLDFSDGFNVFLGENENGKSTCLAFIKMMFYGSEGKSGQISKSIRKKYTPWDGSPMAGSIDFTKNGRNYRIEREFHSSNSTDKVSLIDLDLGKKETVRPDIGAEIFGIGAAAFERSIFIGQFGFPANDAAAESELNAKLSNVTSTGDESVSFDLINARILKPRYELISKSGRTGKYDKGCVAAADLKKRLDNAAATKEKYTQQKALLSQHISETDALAAKSAVLKARLSKEQDIRNAEKLKALLQTKAELENEKEKSKLKNGEVLNDFYIGELKLLLSKNNNAKNAYEAAETKANIINEQLCKLNSAPEIAKGLSLEEEKEQLNALLKSHSECENEITSVQADLTKAKSESENKNALKKPLNPVLLAAGGTAAAAGALLFIISLSLPGILCLAAGILFAVMGFILRPTDTKALEKLSAEISAFEEKLTKLNDKKTEITAKIAEIKMHIDTIELAGKANSELIAEQTALLSKATEEKENLRNIYTAENEKLILAAEKAGIGKDSDIAAEIEKLAEKISAQKEIKQRLNLLLNDLNGISYEAAQKKLDEMGDGAAEIMTDFEQLRSEYETLESRITERRTKEATAAANLKNMLAGCEAPDVLKKELKELIDKLNAEKRFCDAADIASSVLADSFAELRRSFGSELEKRAGKLFSDMTDGKYIGMGISDTFAVTVEQRDVFGSKESDYLSSGTQDQAYLSLRLAVSELITDEKLPVFLDDSLAQYDDKRCKTAVSFLNVYAKERQAIMFTCHRHIADTAADSGATVSQM